MKNCNISLSVVLFTLLLTNFSFGNVIRDSTVVKIPDQVITVGCPAKLLVLSQYFGNYISGNLSYSVKTSNSFVAGVSILDDTLKLSPIAQGITILTVKASNETGDSLVASFKVIINPITHFAISGRVTYDNSAASPLTGVVVILAPVNFSASTAKDGTFSLGSGCFSNIPLTITASSTQKWIKESVNATDALMAALYFLDPVKYPLSDLRKEAADVNNNGIINNTDAFLIIRRMIGEINSFDKCDWIFTSKEFLFNGAPSTSLDLKGILAGDVNGSYIPGGTQINNSYNVTLK